MILSLHPLKASRQLRWDLIVYKALSSLHSETSRSRLGFAWWILDPVLYMCVFYVVFGLIFERGGPDFVVKLLIALVVWRWFDNSVKACASSLVTGVGLMRQVYVSKFLFPLAAIIAQSLKFLAVLSILLAFLVIYGIELSASWLGLIPILLTELLFIGGLGILLAAIIPFFPDLKILIDYGIQLGFFLSGIFYDISQIPDSVAVYFHLNPMAMFIDQSRQVLLLQQGPDWAVLGWIAIASLAMIALGSYLLGRYDRDYPTLLLT